MISKSAGHGSEQGGGTHLVFEVAYQAQQLLHAPLKGRRVVAGMAAHRQGVSIKPRKVTNDPGVRTGQLDSLSSVVGLRVRLRLSPAMK